MAEPASGQARERRVHYIHSMSYTAQERVVGGFVIAGLIILLLMFAITRGTLELFEEPTVSSDKLTRCTAVQ